MSDYDNTNKGSLFRPNEKTPAVSLEGTINIDGVDHNVIVTKRTNDSGKEWWDVYFLNGKLFKNDSDKEGAPNVRGFIGTSEQKLKDIAAWRNKSSKGVVYYGVKVEAPWVPEDQRTAGDDYRDKRNTDEVDFDDIPF